MLLDKTCVGWVSEDTDLLLDKLAGTLVLAVAEQFDDAALVGGEAGEGVSAHGQTAVIFCVAD